MNPDMPSPLPGDPMFSEIIGRLLTDAGERMDKQWQQMGQMRWIPVRERLPAENEPVLVWMPDLPHAEHGMDIGSYMNSSLGVDWMVSGGRSAFPSHWMPLPHPPGATP